jgi:hypothetical protein
VLGGADQPSQLDQHADERLAREGTQPPRHAFVALPLHHLLSRLPVAGLEADVAARPRQRLHALWLVVVAGAVEGCGAATSHGVHLGFGRIVASQIEVPNMFAIPV